VVGTFEALLVLLVAVLPGVVYTVALEHRGETWAWANADATGQLLRFVAASGALHAAFAPVTYSAYRQLIVTHALSEGEPITLWWWPVLLAYLFIPYVCGDLAARSRHWGRQSVWFKRWVKRFVGLYTVGAREPTAWDWVFGKKDRQGWIRLRLTDGSWKAGRWADAYASGYGEEPDLYLSNQAILGSDGGFVMDGDTGQPKLMGSGLLIKWSEVRYLELITRETQAQAVSDG
jgi:hypothetical protein